MNMYTFRDTLHTKNFDKIFVGFDKFAEKLASVHEQAAAIEMKYPPYNLKKIDENKYTIEIAVAGFARQDLDIEIVEDKLIIKGNTRLGESAEKDSAGEWTWPQILHQGLAMRPFTRTFNLADNVEIRGATIRNGILKIDLEGIIPAHKKPKKVDIQDEETTPSAPSTAEYLAERREK